jgi:hypothetical protein
MCFGFIQGKQSRSGNAQPAKTGTINFNLENENRVDGLGWAAGLGELRGRKLIARPRNFSTAAGFVNPFFCGYFEDKLPN